VRSVLTQRLIELAFDFGRDGACSIQ
jgi:hypothetical protein